MKKIIVALFLTLFIFNTASLFSQNSIDIKTVDNKIQIKLKNDGKLYAKTYNNWDEVKKDSKLKKFSKNFASKCIGMDLSEGFNFDLDEGFHLIGDGINISINTFKKEEGGTISISIDASDKKKKKTKKSKQ